MLEQIQTDKSIPFQFDITQKNKAKRKKFLGHFFLDNRLDIVF